MNDVLGGQVAAVSGGLGDIGSAVARELARRGAAVAVSDRAKTGPSGVHYAAVDVRDPAAVRAWFDAVAADLGPPTVVVPCAATGAAGGVRDLDPAVWSDELDVTLSGAFHVAQAGAQRMLAAGVPGRIVLVGSWAAHAPHPRVTAYSVAKAGLRMLGRCLALELAPHGILVNEVAPGYVDAGLSRAVWESEPLASGEAGKRPAEPGARERAVAHVPIGRLLDPDDVARQVAFLCGPDADQMTGSVLLADGGLSLCTDPEWTV